MNIHHNFIFYLFLIFNLLLNFRTFSSLLSHKIYSALSSNLELLLPLSMEFETKCYS